jgi:site-specific recombinase XerD
LNAYRASRPISARTWSKELEIVRHFFRHCLDNDWCLRNPASKVQAPKNLKPADREPYEPSEIAKIIATADFIGRGPYERLRARAMVLLLRYTALRISDVATLERDRVRDGETNARPCVSTPRLLFVERPSPHICVTVGRAARAAGFSFAPRLR